MSQAPGTYAGIEQLVHGGGQIMIGSVKPIKHAAVAHDGHKTLVMLRCKPGEPLIDILGRLEAAIAVALSTGHRVDEVNRPDANRTYEY